MDVDNEPFDHIGTVIFANDLRAETRVIGVGKLAFAMQSALTNWDWFVVREVETKGDVRKLCEALGYSMMFGTH